MTCACQDTHEQPAIPPIDALRAALREEITERLQGSWQDLAEVITGPQRATWTREVPSDTITTATYQVGDVGTVIPISRVLDRIRVRIDTWATDGEGGGLIVVVVGAPDQTLDAQGNGRGVPLIYTEELSGPAASLTLATRAPLEMRVIQIGGRGVISVTQELADPA